MPTFRLQYEADCKLGIEIETAADTEEIAAVRAADILSALVANTERLAVERDAVLELRHRSRPMRLTIMAVEPAPTSWRHVETYEIKV